MILGMHGLKQSGKDTVAAYLVENYGFERKAFADKVKEAICATFDISLEELETFKNDPYYHVAIIEENVHSSMSFRQFIQRFATEGAREIYGYDFWVTLLMDQIYLMGLHNNYVISDVRFENELMAINTSRRIVDGDNIQAGYNIHILRPGIESDGHASEIAYPQYCDYVIHNEGTLDDLYLSMDFLMEDLQIEKT